MAAEGRSGDGHPDNDPPLGDIPEFDRGELQSDTLAFERIKRRPPERRRRIIIILVLLVLAGGGYAGWLTLGEQFFGKSPDTVPVIRAAEGPVKVRPDKPGGIEIKNRDIEVYKRIGGDQPERSAEKLLPRPEAPLPTPAPEQPPAIKAGASAATETEPKAAEKLIAGAEAKDDDAAARPSPEKVEASQEPPPPPPPPEVKGGTTAASPGPRTQPQTPPQVLVPPPAPAPAKPAAAATATGGGYSVQLAAVRDENAARGEWRRLRGRHAELLGTLSLNVVRADLGPKGIFYRVRAGTLADKAAARTLCQALARKKVGCLVVPPGG